MRSCATLTRITAILAGVFAASSGLVVIAGPAQAADCAPVIDAIAVHDVVVYAASSSRITTTVTTHDPCTDQRFSTAGILDVNGSAHSSDGVIPWQVSYRHSLGSTWTGVSGANFDKYSAIGRGSQRVEVTDFDLNTSYIDGLPFYVRRNVGIQAFNVAPEPVRRGSTIRLTGLVKRLSVDGYGNARYVPYVGHRTDIYFRPLTSGKYTKVSTTTTTAAGTFARAITATVDGCWKSYSTQTSYNVGRWSGADCVDVI
jgi:hypothetical protein